MNFVIFGICFFGFCVLIVDNHTLFSSLKTSFTTVKLFAVLVLLDALLAVH